MHSREQLLYPNPFAEPVQQWHYLKLLMPFFESVVLDNNNDKHDEEVEYDEGHKPDVHKLHVGGLGDIVCSLGGEGDQHQQGMRFCG